MAAPLRMVTDANHRSGRGGMLGEHTFRRVRRWYLRLECGHEVSRRVKYRPGTGDLGGPGGDHTPDDLLPAPRRARCEKCAP